MSRTVFDRLGVKTPDHRFRHELEAGFEMPPRVAQSVLELAKNVFNPDGLYGDKGGRLRPGQIRHIIAAAAAPRGRPLRETEMMEVVWTIDAGEEIWKCCKCRGPSPCVGCAFCAWSTRPWTKAESQHKRTWVRP